MAGGSATPISLRGLRSVRRVDCSYIGCSLNSNLRQREAPRHCLYRRCRRSTTSALSCTNYLSWTEGDFTRVTMSAAGCSDKSVPLLWFDKGRHRPIVRRPILCSEFLEATLPISWDTKASLHRAGVRQRRPVSTPSFGLTKYGMAVWPQCCANGCQSPRSSNRCTRFSCRATRGRGGRFLIIATWKRL